MEIKKTVGHPKLDYHINGKIRKGYVIHTKCGQKFHCKPVGSQGYECGGVNFLSIKEIKAEIVSGGFAADEEAAPTEASTSDGADTWDCIHPCALLIQMNKKGFISPQEMKETLDSYGWLDVMGRPDDARAEREIKRIENLRKENLKP